MKTKIVLLFSVAILLLFAGCAERVNTDTASTQHPTATPIVTAAPIVTATPILTATPTAKPTETPKTPIIAEIPENIEQAAPHGTSIPVGIAFPITNDADNASEPKMIVSRSINILGGYINNAYYFWDQYEFGNPPLLGYDFINRYREGDGDHYPYPVNALIQPNRKFYLYDMEGNRYPAETTKKLWIYTDEGQGYLDIEYQSQSKIPNGYYIAVFGEWDAMPRKGKITDDNGSMEVDLDGDGTIEPIQAVHTKTGYGEDCMFVARYKNTSYLLQKYGISQSNFGVLQYGVEELPSTFTYVFPLDINGDGVMEIVTGGRTSEGAEEMFIYGISDDKLKMILGWCIAP